jgi:acetone carboxylase gamma subunit
MKVPITEYLRIDLDSEHWECAVCNQPLNSARANYKEGLLIHARDPREIHRPLIDPKLYEYTFAPDPTLCVIYEFYCPGCGTLVETEYTVPGHMPLHDIELDIDALKAQWQGRQPPEASAQHGPDVELLPGRHAHPHHHGHHHPHPSKGQP